MIERHIQFPNWRSEIPATRHTRAIRNLASETEETLILVHRNRLEIEMYESIFRHGLTLIEKRYSNERFVTVSEVDWSVLPELPHLLPILKPLTLTTIFDEPPPKEWDDYITSTSDGYQVKLWIRTRRFDESDGMILILAEGE